MKFRAAVQVSALAVVAVFAIGIWSVGDEVRFGWLQFYSAAVFFAVVALNLWDRYLWYLAWPQRLRGVPRNVRGTWKGTLTSQWIDPDINSSPEPRTVYLVVRQTATTASAVLFTPEAQSRSTLARVQKAVDGAVLEYMYLGEPDSRVEDRSRMHRGASRLTIVGSPATRLKGGYWTNRGSRGELEFSDRRLKSADDYRQAGELFS